MTAPEREDGFTLLEIVCVLSIVAMLAAIAFPAFPRASSRARLEGFAIETAALLKGDRNAALRRGAHVATELDAAGKTIRSGAGGRVLRFPNDVGFKATLAERCGRYAAGTTIDFFPTGMSCGGSISLSRLGATFEIHVNWLTGGIDVVPAKT
ncbi:prepilin-type N-terminal cleavage/methylation domain-containing protein [Methylocapsa palsarum]|uniref:General secretion pathway protein H n=1 Tax=Methylocapsa palsarum TaxID=1612308 RepID=A0A1I4CCL4_9HYPH|nr:prepilin-type N-terminal cleavage/methylation domain-containing protein [Methylocapsa palsarum]SFK78019.1 general secretion pathway protein H [Methylocapsa palsarum]